MLLAMIWLWQSGLLGSEAPAPVDSRPATALLQAFQCSISERKEFILRGVEDAYDPSNEEPAELSEQASSPRTQTRTDRNIFDNSQADNGFLDHAAVPSRISSGLLVIRMRALPTGGSENDVLHIGDRSRVADRYQEPRPVFSRDRPSLEEAGWTRDGDVYSVQISEIPFESQYETVGAGQAALQNQNEYATLLDYIRSGERFTIVDLMVQDDTSIDFWGLAVCIEPLDGNGLTMSVRSDTLTDLGAGLVRLENETSDDQYFSNPYTGDTPCETELPLACFLDLDLPLPRQYRAARPDFFIRRYWSGGIIAATPPVAASTFVSIADADAYCAAEFGDRWRVLTYHDGGQPAGIAGFGGLSDTDQRYWTDIRGQPYGTCWGHE